MQPAELIDHWRKQADDLGDLNGQGALWDDSEIIVWLDDAQRMFCRLTEGIEDLLTIELEVGQEWVVKNPLILKTSGARFRSTLRPDFSDDVMICTWDAFHRECRYGFDGRAGRLRFLVDGVRKGYFRTAALPNEAGTIELMVNRLPISVLEGDLEIDDQHHLALCEWIFKRAYGKHDADTFDPQKAARFEQSFREYCEQAQREQTRARVQPTPVRYGGY